MAKKSGWAGGRDVFTFAVIFAVVVGLWLYASIWIDGNINIANEAHKDLIAARGQFGDKFGAINSLFSGFAFAGIIMTLLLQRRDLRETHNAMGRERFDSTFFQLIQLHIDITSKLTIKGGSAGIEALVAFDEKLRNSDHDFVAFQVLQKLSDDIVTRMKDTKSINPTICPDLTLSEIANIQERLNVGVSFIDNYMIERLEYHKLKVINAYTAVAAQNIDSFSHYFRNLYHILKFVDCAEFLSESEKKVYTNFLRSQLSDVELVCLFYNSIAVILLPGRNGMELGYPKMQVLLKKYNVLQNMNPRSVIHPLHFKVFEA